MRQTLDNLKISRRHRATIVKDHPTLRGMLKRAKEFIAWCDADAEIIGALLDGRGMMKGGRPVPKNDLEKLGFKSMNEMAKVIASGDRSLSSIKDLKPSFALAPPRGGYKKSTRRSYGQGGVLGANPALKSLVKIMI